MNDFTDKTVFITGASRGIGLDIKKYFENLGAKVIAPTREEMDLSDTCSVDCYLDKNNENVDIIVHCAGVNKLSGIEEISEETMLNAVNVNILSAIKIIKHYVKGMKERKYGKIVFITSLYSAVSKEKRIAYSTTKTALLGLERTLALELAPFNIMVNSVAPGYVMTDMTRVNLSDEEIKTIEKTIPTGRFQESIEIAEAVGFLCSESNKSITGQSLFIDGGFLCR